MCVCVFVFIFIKNNVRQDDKTEQLLQELRTREQELEFTLTKQREVIPSFIYLFTHLGVYCSCLYVNVTHLDLLVAGG